MKEYTLLAAVSVLITLIIDRRMQTFILSKGLFWVFIVIIIFFKFLVNGYLTSSGIVLYNPNSYLGIRLGSIPLEDFLFGFSMVTLGIIFWEYFKKNK